MDASDAVGISITVGGKAFVWRYLVRVDPKKPRVAVPDCVAIRCDFPGKEMLIEAAPHTYFNDHYGSFPAVRVRPPHIEEADLKALAIGLAAPGAQGPRQADRRGAGRLRRDRRAIAPGRASRYLRPPTENERKS